jgi:hypothetical protein
MTKIVVQLDAYVIPDDHLVFKVSPGKTYRFYRAVRDANAIFLDIRGLETLRGAPRQWEDNDVLNVIAEDRWQRELESRARGNEPHGSEGVGKTDRRNLTFLKHLLLDAKKGDLVVVPVEGYINDVLIGELTTDSGEVRRIVAKDGEYQHVYLGRPVLWREAIPKRLLSEDLIKALHTQTAIFTLGRSLLEEVYRLAFGNFIHQGRFVSEFHTAKEKFTAEDSAVVSTWFNGFDVLRHAMATGAVANLPDSFYLMGLEKLADRDAAELRININSPGSFSLKSGDAFALTLMVLFALSGCDSQAIIQDQVTVQLKTVGNADVGCQHQIEADVNATATALGAKRLEEACQLGERAENDARISTSATLQTRPRRRR